jgi:Flp pilus assembly protein TadG
VRAVSTRAPTERSLHRRDERGVVLVWASLLLVVLVGFAGFSVDVGHWYLRASRLQNAADAAAMGGVVLVAADLDQARATARQVAGAHGHPAADVQVERGERSNQLRVTIEQRVDNFFVGVFGLRATTIRRTAVAEYQGTVAMGSPEPILGNDPERGYAPDYWLNTGSLRNSPDNGDRYHSASCGGNAPCRPVHPQNPEYAAHGYVYAVDVGHPRPGQDLVIQVFDPAFYEVGDRCLNANGFFGDVATVEPRVDALHAASSSTPLVPNDWYAGQAARYERGPGPWCTGNWQAGTIAAGPAWSTTPPIDVTYVVRQPDDTPWSDLDNPVIETATCAPRQFTGRDRNWMNARPFHQRLTPGDGEGEWQVLPGPGEPWRQTLANTFRRWVTICRIPAAQVRAGTYLVQVRTTAPRGHPLDTDLTLQTWGNSRYSLRAGYCDSLACGAPGGGAPSPTGLTVHAQGRLPIFVNTDGADTEFFLARVLPGGANRMLLVSLWDISDGGSPGSMQVVRPRPGDTSVAFSDCSFHTTGGSWTVNPANCSFSFTANSLNAQLVSVTVPIPDTYSCAPSNPDDCWIKIRAPFAGTVSDNTTWSAEMLGDPVRLVE